MVVRSEAKLERVAVAARNEDGAAPLFFGCGSGGEKIICLEAWRFRILKAAGGHEIRQDFKLLKHGVVEFASALVSRKFLMSVGSDFQRVPGDEHGARLLLAVEAQQHIGKTENGTRRLAAAPQDGFRQGVIGAMREGIPIDDQQRLAGTRRCTPRPLPALRPHLLL